MLSLCCLLVAIASVSAGGNSKSGPPVEGFFVTELFEIGIDTNSYHCSYRCREGKVRRIKVNIGSNNKRSPGSQSTTVSKFVIHGGYVGTKYVVKNDIAMLTLNTRVREDRCVKFAKLASKGETFGTSRCIAAGWGNFAYKGQSPDQLFKVTLPAIPADVCKRRSKMRISDGILCAGDFTAGGTSTCQGDSGGPLYCRNRSYQTVLAGVTSFGSRCNGEVSAFTDVGYFRDWIDSNLVTTITVSQIGHITVPQIGYISKAKRNSSEDC
ncbi:chymotrypsin-1-like [Octopus vulgaris]|uniref:Chymotrypsin-1-like n=1 Tax=Octopus vulgaris TaxID=6645 RepID=A0AA36AYZ2_OCTVU|nr:chymotrypsin-1-like [Octopus vulgaris]